MLELTPENTPEYLLSRGWVTGLARVEPLGWGVSNAVFRVETDSSLFVLKQSRPQLRTRDAWFSDLNRVYRELEVMQVLHPLLPAPTVPEVLHVDRDNYVFAMAHAPLGSMVWKEELLAGQLDARVAEKAGTVLGRMHQMTAANPHLVSPFADSTVFVQLRIDPFYRRVQERRPEVVVPIEKIIQRMLTWRGALCHGDFTPKNLLVHDEGFTLVDYETAYHGDPTMDLGLFLAHLLLKALRQPATLESFFDLTRAFWTCYWREVQFHEPGELMAWAIEHCGVSLLARVDGTSPVDYLSDVQRADARRLGLRLLLEPAPDWRTVLKWCRAEVEQDEQV